MTELLVSSTKVYQKLRNSTDALGVGLVALDKIVRDSKKTTSKTVVGKLIHGA